MSAGDKPCPFCGSTDIRYVGRAGRFDNEHVYCNGCKTEFTNIPPHIGTMWNHRAGVDRECCPFCGGDIEYDGIMNYSTLFCDAYCPTCGWRFEFQDSRLPHIDEDERDPEKLDRWGRKCVEKARKAFARRYLK